MPSICAARTLLPEHNSRMRSICSRRTSSSGSGLHNFVAAAAFVVAGRHAHLDDVAQCDTRHHQLRRQAEDLAEATIDHFEPVVGASGEGVGTVHEEKRMRG